MSRGDVVIVTTPGDYGKPRPAIIVQSNAIPESHASIVICPMTSELAEADFRITIEPGFDLPSSLRLEPRVAHAPEGDTRQVASVRGHGDGHRESLCVERARRPARPAPRRPQP